MSDGPPTDWSDRGAWDRYFKAELQAGRIPNSAPVLRFLPFTRKMGGRVWFAGCGLEQDPLIYATRGRTVLATDFSSVAVKFQRVLAEGIQKEGTWGPMRGTFAVAEQDFTEETPETEVDVVINTRAFQGLSAAAMHAAARRFHAALRPGGACIIDTMNVQGALRDRIEDSLIAGGFYLPYRRAQRWYREQLEHSGIVYEMLMGHPRVRPSERSEEDQAVLDSFRAEYERRTQEEAAEVQAIAEDKTTVIAQVVYTTG